MYKFEISKELKLALDRISISTKSDILGIIEPIEMQSRSFEDLVLANLVRGACVSIRSACGKGCNSDGFSDALQDISKVDKHLRSQG